MMYDTKPTMINYKKDACDIWERRGRPRQERQSIKDMDTYTSLSKGSGLSAYVLVEHAKDLDELDMPLRGFSFKRSASSSSSSSSSTPSVINTQTDGQFSFQQLVKEHFRSSDTLPRFSRKDIHQPLLTKTPDGERELVMKLWRAVLRFMGDLPDYRRNLQSTKQPNMGSVMTRLYRQMDIYQASSDLRPVSAVKDLSTGTNAEAPLKNLPNKPKGSTLKRLKATLTLRLNKGQRKSIFHTLPLEETLISPADQVHFITGCCILKPQLRDEVYVQVCKQLLGNSIKASVTQGWLLLSFLVASFPPSAEIAPYIERVLESGPPATTALLKKLQQRTAKHGSRCQPLSHLEIECYTKKRPMELNVTLMDGSSHTVVVDSATTASELVEQLAVCADIKQHYGFSVFTAMQDKWASLGCGVDHVFDSISQCEQIFRDEDGDELLAPWRLFVRKEVFSAWDTCVQDAMAVHLIYSQVVRGLMLGEYVCQSDKELAELAAQQYLIDYGEEIMGDSLIAVLPAYIPEDRRRGDLDLEQWKKLVIKAYHKLFTSTGRPPPSELEVKVDIVQYARSQWSEQFSMYYDAFKLAGPDWGDGEEYVKVGVNCKGLLIMTEQRRVLMKMGFEEISTVTGESESRQNEAPIIVIILVSGVLIKLGTADAPALRGVIRFMLDGLRARSVWAVAKHDYTDGDFSMNEGDLMKLTKPASAGALTSASCTAVNLRTNQTGSVSSHMIYVMATLHRPSAALLKLYRTPWAKSSYQLSSDGEIHINNGIDQDAAASMGESTHVHDTVRLSQVLPSQNGEESSLDSAHMSHAGSGSGKQSVSFDVDTNVSDSTSTMNIDVGVSMAAAPDANSNEQSSQDLESALNIVSGEPQQTIGARNSEDQTAEIVDTQPRLEHRITDVEISDNANGIISTDDTADYIMSEQF